MNKKWSADLIKAFFTLVFVLLSYFLASLYNLAAYFPLIPTKSQFPLSVALYTSFLNFSLFFYLSFKTNLKISVTDKRDRSNKIKVGKQPRRISVKVEVTGNNEDMKAALIIKFPQWIDITKTQDPDIITINQHEYKCLLNKNMSSYTCYFDINLNELYVEAIREDEIKVEFKGSRLRYSKEIKGLSIHNR
ncbi:hypothetical protein [Staphylococcus delphini]|uniref:hypothetical protein n=1 Tax=Staphylococcus delphini TaxID=53344 RepID=UPI0012D35557|nr:hypothetical protein [Staphylococcus delphini]MTV19174.1 hypothetical protein [Staphylococcus delphini]